MNQVEDPTAKLVLEVWEGNPSGEAGAQGNCSLRVLRPKHIPKTLMATSRLDLDNRYFFFVGNDYFFHVNK